MKRKTSHLLTKIYTYGLAHGPEPESAPLINAQIRAAHDYQNSLIAIERWRRERYRELIATPKAIADLDARIATKVGELEALRAALGKRRQDARRRVEDKERTAQIRALRESLKVLRGERKAATKDQRENPAMRAALDAMEDEARTRIKAARAATSCYWGTYLLVERAMEATRKSVTDPRFRRWNQTGAVWTGASLEGEGRIGVQLQGGLSVPALYACEDTRLRVAPVDPSAYDTRSGRRGQTRTTLQIRVGSAGRAPVWATFRGLKLHRPLPPDAIIKEAWVQRRRFGLRFRWTLQLSIEAASFEVAPKTRGPRCAIDLGWRVREDGLRVGYLVGSDGERRELVVPSSIIARINHANTIRGIRRRNFDLMRDQLVRWLATRAEPLPEWLALHAQWIAQWRSEARLDRLVWTWSANRMEGDDELFATLNAWRKQNQHLAQWDSCELHRALAARREHYRTLAVAIAQRYSTVVIEELDLRHLKRNPRPEEDKTMLDAVKRNQQQAAAGELRASLILAASNRGTAIVKVSSVDSTATCHACGCICKWDQARHIEHTCEHCGAHWDQDANAAINLLARASGPAPSAPRGPLANRANA